MHFAHRTPDPATTISGFQPGTEGRARLQMGRRGTAGGVRSLRVDGEDRARVAATPVWTWHPSPTRAGRPWSGSWRISRTGSSGRSSMTVPAGCPCRRGRWAIPLSA